MGHKVRSSESRLVLPRPLPSASTSGGSTGQLGAAKSQEAGSSTGVVLAQGC